MGKFDRILICTDLDGTLYRGDKTISRENTEAIEYFKREGGLFTFITGRMPQYATEAYRAVRPNAPFGCVNGGALYDGARGEYVWAQTMPDTVKTLLACVDAAFPQVGMQVCTLERTYFVKESEVMAWFRRVVGIENVACHYRDVTEPIGKILIGSEDEAELAAIERLLRAHPLASEFSFVRSERVLFEILPLGVHKGLALARLAEHFGDAVRATVAIGDYHNDIGMFGAATLGVAVANACPEAKAAADCVTVSNEEHAIARVISDIERGVYAL